MLDPYRMVVVNIIASALVLGGIVFYKFIFPKKKINLLVILLIISVLPVISIFRAGTYESGDFNIHIYRTIDFYKSLSQGVLMPSWGGDLNATFGYPLFIFLNPFPYYSISLLHLLGFSFINAGKVFLALSYVLSGIFFYYFARNEIKNSLAAFLGAIVYLFSPYHLVDLHFRAAIGEVSFFMALPLFFYCLSKFNKIGEKNWFILSSLALALMLYSHQALAVFSSLIIFPYFLYSSVHSNTISFKKLFVLTTIPLLGLLYSLYIWLPHLVYTKYTLAYLLSNSVVIFPKFIELLYSPWRYGFLFQGPKGELSFLIGYIQIFILLSSFFIFNNKKNKPYILLWIFSSLIVLFMITPFSAFIWKAFPILNTAQFSTRLLLLLSFTIAMLSGYFATRYKKYTFVIYVIASFTIFSTILNWGHRRVIPEITDTTLIYNLPKSTSQGEGYCCMAQPKWTLPNPSWVSYKPSSHIEILLGNGEIKQLKRTQVVHEYQVKSNKNLIIKENTWYFPGWTLLIDGKKTQINYTNKKYPGIITFNLPPGNHHIVLFYKDLDILSFAKTISLISILVSIIILFSSSFKKSIKKLYTAV